MTKNSDKSVQILGVEVTGNDRDRVLRRLMLQRKNLMHIVTVNPEFVMEARQSEKFKKALEEAEETVADGWGIVWAAEILYGMKLPRITGVELVDYILEKAEEKEKRVFLLGAAPGVAEKAAEEMKKKYPKLEIESYSGSRNVKREKREEMGLTLAKINGFEPDFLFVAYGSPWQDLWIEENREYLRAKVVIGVGGVLDEWAGEVRRCPRIIDKLGLKWLWRLVNEPWRWRRQLDLLKFVGLVMVKKLKKDITS